MPGNQLKEKTLFTCVDQGHKHAKTRTIVCKLSVILQNSQWNGRMISTRSHLLQSRAENGLLLQCKST